MSSLQIFKDYNMLQEVKNIKTVKGQHYFSLKLFYTFLQYTIYPPIFISACSMSGKVDRVDTTSTHTYLKIMRGMYGTGRTHMTCGKAFGEQLYDVYLYFQRMIDVQSILC
jgi:hypothetical protein